MNFHDVRFPTQISLGASGGPERRTDVVVLGSGFEERNARWADSRRSYNAGYGVRSLDDLHEVIAFFEERRGQLYGFRWRDPIDWSSSPPEAAKTALDQTIGIGDGTTATYQLTKIYGASHAPWSRRINKPDAGSFDFTYQNSFTPGCGGVVANSLASRLTTSLGGDLVLNFTSSTRPHAP